MKKRLFGPLVYTAAITIGSVGVAWGGPVSTANKDYQQTDTVAETDGLSQVCLSALRMASATGMLSMNSVSAANCPNVTIQDTEDFIVRENTASHRESQDISAIIGMAVGSLALGALGTFAIKISRSSYGG